VDPLVQGIVVPTSLRICVGGEGDAMAGRKILVQCEAKGGYLVTRTRLRETYSRFSEPPARVGVDTRKICRSTPAPTQHEALSHNAR